MRTIAARIRNTKTELDELGETMTEANYEEVVKQLTDFNVALTDANGEYRSTYDIMSDIAAKWSDMTSMEQAALADALSGTRQQAVFYSIIEQFQEASGAMDAMSNSAGALENAYSMYMETATAHINQFKASFQELASNLISGGLITTIVDIGTAIVNMVNALQKVHLLLPAIVTTVAIIKGLKMARVIAESNSKIATLTSGIIAEKGATDALSVSVSQLTIKEKQRLATNIQNAIVSGQLTAEEGAQILSTLGLATAEGTLTVANKGLAASFKSVMASIPVWGWIALGISVLVEAIGWMTSSFDNSTDSIKELDEEFKQLKDTIDSTATNFRNLKESADSTIPRFVELAQGANEFGENVSLTDEEYAEFLKLNNKIAEMFPELNLGMDSSGNAMLALSYSADTLTDSLNKLVEAQRNAAYETIAATMPDVLENISEFENEYKKQISKIEAAKTSWGAAYQKILDKDYFAKTVPASNLDDANEQLKILVDTAKSLGLTIDKATLKDTKLRNNIYLYYEIEWDYESVDNNNIKKLYDAKLSEQDKLINDLQSKIAAKWKSINPIINSWLQTDFIFNDLNSKMQSVAEMIVSGLDFSKLGLTTKEEVTDYITQNILDPLFLAGDDVKEAFASIVDWQDQLKKGQISSEEFSQKVKGAFDSLISSMDEDKVEQFKSIFISSMNAMGISGDDFDAVIEQLIASWGRFSDSSTSNNFSKFIKDATENLENLTKKLQTLQSQSSSIQSELNSLSNSMNSLNNGEILSYESLLQLIEKYPLYATELANAADNAELQKQALEHLFEAKKNDYILTQKSAIDTIKASNEQTKVIIRNSELEMKARAKSVGGQWDRDIEEFIERRFANEKKQIAENEKLIEEYEAKIKFAEGLSIDDLVTTSSKSSTKAQTWFDKQYNYHKHMVNMEKETEKDYFNWLDNAYKKAYSEGIIDLDNYYKYEEEVYNGRKKLYGDTTSWFERDYKTHQHLRNMEAESDKKYYDWLEGAYKKAYKEGLIDLDAYRKYEEEVYNGRKKLNGEDSSWFEKEYKLHQHLLNMDSEGQKDYLNWLSSAYKKAYKEGLITLDDYRKYQEEVYKGLQSLFKDYLSDIEHEIDMRSSIEGNNKKIISLYKELIKKVEKEIKAARASGLDDTDDYIQELQKKWLSYSDEIKKIQDDTKDNAKSAVEKLVDIRLKMLKQDIDSEKDALNKKLSNLKDFYQKQKEMLQDAYDEEKYLEERSEKRKSVSDIKAQLKQLEYDDSAWAQKRKLELSDELIEAQKELKDFEREHSIDVTQDRLDKLYEAQEDKINKKIETLESKESDAQSLYKKALSDIKNGSIQLYEEMIDWNNVYGDGIKDTIADAWEEAYKALLDYKNLFGSFYKNIKLYNATGYIVPQGTWDNSPVSNNGAKSASASSAKTSTSSSQSSGDTTTKTNTTTTSNTSSSKTSTNTSQQSTAKLDDNTKRKVAAAIWRGTYGWGAGDDRTKKLNEVFGANNGIQTLVNQGVGLNDSAPSNDYTYLNMRKKFKGYASGTSKALAGLHAIDELGTETIFESSDGTKYKMFTGGEKVLNAKASDFLYKFATGGTAILEKIIQYASGGNLNNISPPVVQNQISMGNIIVEGNADRATVSEIRRAQRDSIDTMLKALNRLSK